VGILREVEEWPCHSHLLSAYVVCSSLLFQHNETNLRREDMSSGTLTYAYKHIIPATWEAEVEKIVIGDQSQQKVRLHLNLYAGTLVHNHGLCRRP
jgi:hypothetical protein